MQTEKFYNVKTASVIELPKLGGYYKLSEKVEFRGQNLAGHFFRQMELAKIGWLRCSNSFPLR